MTRLKIILQSKIFYIILIFLTSLYSFVVVKNNLFLSRFNKHTKEVEGTITSIKKKDNLNIIELKTSMFENILIYDYSKAKLDIGYKIKVEGTIDKPNINSNFYLFNYSNYLKSNNIYYIMNSHSITIINYGNKFYEIKRCIINRINKINNPYLYTFILGDNSRLSHRVVNSYRNNGISHLFAISGMHVGLIVLLFEFLLKKLQVKTKAPIIIFLLFFFFLTNYSKSIMRAGLIYIMLILNKKYEFKLSTLKILLLLLCIFLIVNPYNIYNISFIFTYLVTISLVVNTKLINRYSNYFIKIFITSFISFIVTIPFLINNYFCINIIGIVLNIIYVPLVSMIIFPLSIIVFVIPYLNNVLNLFILILEKTSLFFTNIKCFSITLCHINRTVFFIYYILIALCIYMMNKRKYYYLLILFILIFIHSNYRYLDKNAYFISLDVKQGDSSLLIIPNNKCNIMIDTGGRYNSDLTSNILIPSLNSKGINKLNYLIITHGDFDHMGEAINLVNNFKVDNVIFNCGSYNDLEKELIKVLDKKKIKYYSCIKELNVDNNKLYFLQTKEYDNENDNSNVVYTELDGYKFMFMGDASITTEKEILNNYNLPNIDVLKVGHHGSKTSSDKGFIDEINPRYSVISVGKNNRYGHPNKEILNNLKDSKIYRTDKNGSIMFKIKNNNLKIETCSP